MPPQLERERAKRDTFRAYWRSALSGADFGGLPEIGGATRHYFWLKARGGGPGLESAVAMSTDEERELREQLARLQQEHRDLDAAISALQHSPGSDLLQVQRLKKRKLRLKDEIARLADDIVPDIIA